MILREEEVRGQVLDHLGLVSSVISRLKLIEKIDSRLPVSKDKGSKVSMGQRVAAMILNGLGFTDDRLYLFPEFLKNKPVERLLGREVSAEHFNDDAMGRCLDEISDYGVTPLFTEIAFEVGLAEHLLGRSTHFDTTSITVYGEYEVETLNESTETSSEKGEPFIITYGHSKEHRSDLKQVIVNLATTGASFPIWMEPHSGNASDKKILQMGASRMQSFCEKLKHSPSFLYVGDSAFYERCVKEQVLFKWLSRVPERLNEAKKWIEMPDTQYTWTDLGNGYKMTFLPEAAYGEVAQRWIMIYSEKASTRETKTLDKQIQKEADDYEKILWHLSNQVFECSHDAEIAGREKVKSLKYHEVHWTIEPIQKHKGRGRPKANAERVVQGFKIIGTLGKEKTRIELVKRHKGRFILASNELDETALPKEAFLSEYKNQYKTEQGFAFIKNNAFEVSSIFLKKPSRIQALMMIMTLCLMVYSFAQYHLRQALEKENDAIPNQIKKPTQHPSIAWVFRLFQGIQLWLIPQNGKLNELVVNLTELTRRIIRYFGPVAEEIYASSG